MIMITKLVSFTFPHVEGPQDVQMNGVNVRGHVYLLGVGPPWTIKDVRPSNNRILANEDVSVTWFCVMCDEDVFFNSRGRCLAWLLAKGLCQDEAAMLMAFVEAMEPIKIPVPPLLVQESEGQYHEAIGKLVDNIEDAAKRGDIAGSEIVPELRRTAKLLPYAREYEQVLVTVMWSRSIGQAEFAEITHIAAEAVTKDVLNEYIRKHGPQLDEEVPKPPRTLDPFTVVIDVNGGNVQAVYADLPLKTVLVDWDNIKEGDRAGVFAYNLLDEMPDETRDQVELALKPEE